MRVPIGPWCVQSVKSFVDNGNNTGKCSAVVLDTFTIHAFCLPNKYNERIPYK